MEWVLPKTLRLEPLPDNARRAAVLWGPLVLAGDLGPEQRGERGRGRGGATNQAVPVFVAAERSVTDWVKPAPGKPGHFRSAGVGRDQDVDFAPFYRQHHRTYDVYWNLFTPDEWEKRAAAHIAEQEKRRRLEAATVAFAQPGEMQAERDFNFQGEDSTPVRVMDRAGRRGSKWFSFELPVDAAHPMVLAVTYHNEESATRTFEVLVDGKRIGEQTVERRSPEQVGRFFDAEYVIPAAQIRGKPKVTVRFQATHGNEIAAVFGIRMVRADAER